MRSLATALIALVTGVAGMVLTFLVADPVTRAYHVSDMEGGRGMFIAFILAPAGFLLGAVTGFVMARTSHAVDVAGYFKAQGVALLVVLLGIGAIGGLSWLAADRPPTIGGKPAVLELEIRLPMDSTVATDLHAADLHASLFENTKYNRFAQLELDSAIVRDGYLTVPGEAWLFTRRPGRELLVGMGTENSSVFELPLPGKPTTADTVWTSWLETGRAADSSLPMNERKYQVRYRVKRGG
ncbi:MAG TPA: hypothetical protein VF187_02940 [Gemmatimonadales bacterium]